MKTGFFPPSIRTFVQSRLTSPAVGMSYRSTTSGCSFAMWRTALWITARIVWDRARLVPRPMVRASEWPESERVVEVHDEADASARHPDADPDAVVCRVHQVH